MLRDKLEANVKQEKAVCAYHNLLSVFEQVFGVSAMRLSKDAPFEKLVERHSLEALRKGRV